MEIISEGDSPITACGFCFSTDKSPTIENGDTIICGAGIGEFAGKIYDMQQQKGYYVRAYATNALGTTYSAGEGIHTILESELPTVNTKEVSTIKNGTAWVGGEVLAEGASPVTEAGVCWGTSPSPAFGNCEGAVALSSGTQAFTGTIKELRGGTSYYLRAYAKIRMVSLTERKFASKLRIYLEQGQGLRELSGYRDLPLSVPWLIARDSC